MSAERHESGEIVLVCDFCGVTTVPLEPSSEPDGPRAGLVEAPIGWSWDDFIGRLRHRCSECTVVVDLADPRYWSATPREAG